jgi:hypothetical protein
MKQIMMVVLAGALTASFGLAQGNDMGAAARRRMKTGRSLPIAAQATGAQATTDPMASMQGCMKGDKMDAMSSTKAQASDTDSMASMKGCMKGDKMSGMAAAKKQTTDAGSMASMKGCMKGDKMSGMATAKKQTTDTAPMASMKHDHGAHAADSKASSGMCCKKDCCKQSE